MRTALLLVGHGSRSKHSDDVMPYYAEAFNGSGEFTEVAVCYLEQGPKVEGALQRIDADRIFVMPVFIAHGHHTRVTIPEALGINGKNCHVDGKEVFYLEPLGRSAHIVALINDRMEEALRHG
ncbi:sirohydrochlorin cobaltochelatase [Methanocella sp. CWC-04]|uniref:Sirohydrochlorin cobaltochelatase n=1 Tax=Methanooceanicella nereidis TaxID=2052831 RepID=A0AAP2REU5_9EURY|nr:CbiX/SirB N-terminal domain-containing protein [Methanocella sp. CWC-04]MCD1296049.1 sirohydrochlorin cobaltochelatase [Methanocella sp. CWC-04]